MYGGYLKSFFKWFGYAVLAFALFITLFVLTQSEEEVEKLFQTTGLTQKAYDWYDYGRFTEEMEDIQFFGRIDFFMTGDTTKLDLNHRFWEFYFSERYDEHFLPATPFVNLDNLELIETNENARFLAENAEPDEIGFLSCQLHFRYAGFGPVYYKVILHAGTEANRYAMKSSYVNLGSKRKMKLNLEHAINRELKSMAKRFYKIKQNEEMLEELYKSIYMK